MYAQLYARIFGCILSLYKSSVYISMLAGRNAKKYYNKRKKGEAEAAPDDQGNTEPAKKRPKVSKAKAKSSASKRK